MFKFFKKMAGGRSAERQERIDLFYFPCRDAITRFIDESPKPSEEDLLTIAVNAKIFLELFKNVPGARDFAAPLITNGLALFAQQYGMSIEASAKRVKMLVADEINALASNGQGTALPSIRSAYIFAKLVGFDEFLPP